MYTYIGLRIRVHIEGTVISRETLHSDRCGREGRESFLQVRLKRLPQRIHAQEALSLAITCWSI